MPRDEQCSNGYPHGPHWWWDVSVNPPMQVKCKGVR